MSFKETPSGQFVMKTANMPIRMAKYAKDDTKEMAVMIVTMFLKHPTKFIVGFVLNTMAWMIALNHLDDFKPLVDLVGGLF